MLRNKITREDFHRALKIERFQFSAPQVDYLFDVLDRNRDNELDQAEWAFKVYDDFRNPLQLIREVLAANDIKGEELLHKFRMKITDDAIDLAKFRECLHKLDSQLNWHQIKTMFKELASKSVSQSKPLVEIPVLIANLTGEPQETVDFRNKTLATINAHLQRTKQEARLLALFEERDGLLDGSLDPHDFKGALRKVDIDTPEVELDQFIRLLDKTSNGRVDYLKFLDLVKIKGNKNYNPSKTVAQRLSAFMH